MPTMQDIGWSMVGAPGRSRHIPSQQDNRATPKSITQNPNQPTQAPKTDSANIVPHDGQISLVALPATALASMFHHLDSVAGFRFAQTCRTCGTEFAHQRSKFTRKAWLELAPIVTRDPPGVAELARSSPYGTFGNPVTMRLKWEKNPGHALRCLYAISQQPDHVHLVNEMWRQAWPKTLWSDLLCDGMPEHWPADAQPWIYIEIQIASDEQLQLPWDWLALNLLYAPAAGLNYYFDANAPQLLSGELFIFCTSLWRPAQADKWQLVMHKTDFCISRHSIAYSSATEDALDMDDSDLWYDMEFPDTVQVTPSNMQQVAITGSWCRVLPDAPWALGGFVMDFTYMA